MSGTGDLTDVAAQVDELVSRPRFAATEAIRRSMSSNRPRNNRLEVAVRRALHRSGLRFYKHRRPIPDLRCEPDIVFTRWKVALFVDGCFWHGCPEHAQWPATNAGWWRQKILATRERDARNDESLRAAGWIVLRFWEHEPVDVVASTVQSALARLKSLRTSDSPRREGPM